VESFVGRDVLGSNNDKIG